MFLSGINKGDDDDDELNYQWVGGFKDKVPADVRSCRKRMEKVKGSKFTI